MTAYAASKYYEVPKTTITNHITNKSKDFRLGRPTAFTETEEKLLVDYVVALAKIGYGLDIYNLQIMIKNVVLEINKKTPFKDSTPGLDWIYG